MIFARRHLISRVTLLVTLVALTIFLLAPREYVSRASLLVQGRTIHAVPGSARQGNRNTIPRKEDVFSELQFFKSRDLLARVLTTDGDPPAKPAMLARRISDLAHRLQVRVVPATNVIELTLRGSGQEQVVALLDRLIREYRRYRLLVRQPRKTVRFLERQAKRLSMELGDDEHQLQLAAAQGSVDPKQELDANLRHKEQLRQEVERLDNRLFDLDLLKQRISRELEKGGRITRISFKDPELGKLVERATGLLLEKNRLLRTFRQGSQALEGLEMEYQQVVREIRKKKQDYLSFLDEEQRSLQQQINRLNRKMVALDTRNKQLLTQMRQQQRLELKRQVLAESLRQVARQSEEARIAATGLASSLAGNVVLLEHPHGTGAPAFPRPRLIGIGLLSGLLLGVALALLQEYFDPSIRGGADIRRVSRFPVIATLPEIRLDEQLAIPLKKKWWLVQRLERAVEIVFVLLLMLVSLPLFLLLTIMVMLADGRPVLYHGIRLGHHKQPFTLYKFRSLVRDAEKRIGSHIMSERMAVHLKLEHRLGRFLRKTRLDELPQLYNVLRGDMTLVGPRPIRPQVYEKYLHKIGDIDIRFLVKPGLIGPSQVFTPHSISHRFRASLDNRYVLRQTSIFRDIPFLLLVLWILLRNIAAHVGRWLKKKVCREVSKDGERRHLPRFVQIGGLARILPGMRRESKRSVKTVTAQLIDMNGSSLLIATASPLYFSQIYLRLEKPAVRGKGPEKKRVAYVRGRIRQERAMGNGQGRLGYVIDYEPVSPLNHYKVHQYFLEGSIA